MSVALIGGSVARRLPTAFTDALREVVARVPGARGAIFLDSEGEAVDEFCERSTTGIRLVGAHLGVVLSLVRDRAAIIGAPEELIVETQRGIILVQALDDRYLVVLEAGPEAPLGIMRRELTRAAAQLRAQM